MTRGGGTKRQRLERLVRICTSFPEVVVVAGNQHRSFRVRKKPFAYYLNDHHGDGIVSVAIKANLEDQRLLVEQDPERFYVPPYIGPRGWVALRLDRRTVDWDLATELLADAYCLQAPARLARELESA